MLSVVGEGFSFQEERNPQPILCKQAQTNADMLLRFI